MADLLTLAEYKGLQGIQPGTTQDDPQITSLIPAASRLVRRETGRNFEVTTGIASARTYQYDGGEIVDIDDCTAVTSVSTDAGVPGSTFPLDTAQWVAMPQDDSDVLYYLLIIGGPYFGASPEMGFRNNLDQYPYLGRRSPLLTVTATWGWTAIPEDVKLATSLILAELVGLRRSEGVSSEAIEGWSRSFGGRVGAQAQVIPNRARDILATYQRINV